MERGEEMIRIFDMSGNETILADYGLICLSFIPESLSPEFFEEDADGVDGKITLGTRILPRTLTTRFHLKAFDHVDYQLVRDEIYKIFDPRKEIFIIDNRQPGKRWKAKVNGAFRPEYINPKTGKFDLEFVSNQPFAESVGTTLDPFNFDTEKWQIGQGLSEVDLFYKQTVSSFQIYNAGTEVIDPKKFPLIIKYKGSSTNLQIKNNTTLDTWQYTGTTQAADTIEINRTRSLKNTVVNVFKDTNRKLITLAPGWNDIVLTGTSGSFEISFDFRFYYI